MEGTFLGDKVTGCEARAKVGNAWSYNSTLTVFEACKGKALPFTFVWIIIISEDQLCNVINCWFSVSHYSEL